MATPSARVTEVRQRILQNVKAGKDPYDGFRNSELGGAIRSVQVWIGLRKLVTKDPETGWKLTDAGEAATKEKN